MNVKTLTDIGLNETQAKAYITLVKNGSVQPPELAEILHIKRPNSYAVLDQLTELGLATKKDVKRKITYYASNPVALEKLARTQRQKAMEYEHTIQASMPTLLNFFHSFSSQPGVSFYQGVEGIKEIYNDMLRTRKDMYVFRSSKDQDLMTTDFFVKFKKRRADLGIKTHMINPSNNPTVWNKQTDKQNNLDRTPINPNLYTADAEITSYGNKVSIISFGEEAIGMIIDSPQIAESIKQIFGLVKVGAEASGKTS